MLLFVYQNSINTCLWTKKKKFLYEYKKNIKTNKKTAKLKVIGIR